MGELWGLSMCGDKPVAPGGHGPPFSQTEQARTMVTVPEDTCGLRLCEVYFSSWGGVRGPRNPLWDGRCGLDPPLALEAPGEVAAPRTRALPHPGPPGPPRAVGGTGHHGLAQGPTWGLEHGPGCPRFLPGPWCLRTRRWDGGVVPLWREADSMGARLL